MTVGVDMPEAEAATAAGRDCRPVVVVVFNQKGGIGKTTTSVNLAVCLAAYGRSTIVIDLDSQSNATAALGLVGPPPRGAYELISGAASLAEARQPTRYPNLAVCGATSELAGADIELAVTHEPQRHLARALEKLPDGVDVVVIDCPPALGMLPVNALVAGDAVLLPVSPEPMARDGLHKAWHHIQRIRANLNPRLAIAGILLTMTEADEFHAQMAETIRMEFGERVLAVEVPRDPRVMAASVRDLPVVVADPEAAVSQAYLALAEELIERVAAGALAAPPGGVAAPGRNGPHPSRARAVETLREWGGEAQASAPPGFAVGAPPLPTWSAALDGDDAPPTSLWWKLGVGVGLIALGAVMGFVAGGMTRAL